MINRNLVSKTKFYHKGSCTSIEELYAYDDIADRDKDAVYLISDFANKTHSCFNVTPDRYRITFIESITGRNTGSIIKRYNRFNMKYETLVTYILL